MIATVLMPWKWNYHRIFFSNSFANSSDKPFASVLFWARKHSDWKIYNLNIWLFLKNRHGGGVQRRRHEDERAIQRHLWRTHILSRWVFLITTKHAISPTFSNYSKCLILKLETIEIWKWQYLSFLVRTKASVVFKKSNNFFLQIMCQFEYRKKFEYFKCRLRVRPRLHLHKRDWGQHLRVLHPAQPLRNPGRVRPQQEEGHKLQKHGADGGVPPFLI